MTCDLRNHLLNQAEQALLRLGADSDLIATRGLPLFQDAHELTLAHISQSGRRHYLSPQAATCWRQMHAAAALDDVSLIMISGFRSFFRQEKIIQERLDKGEDVNGVLAFLAPPGCSEHHSGGAVDIGTMGSEPLNPNFDQTKAFAWLAENAAGFGFRMSFPADNPYGYLYEPWHWCCES